MKFDEEKLENGIIELLKIAEYTYIQGENLCRETEEVLIESDLRDFLFERYKKDEITDQEVE